MTDATTRDRIWSRVMDIQRSGRIASAADWEIISEEETMGRDVEIPRCGLLANQNESLDVNFSRFGNGTQITIDDGHGRYVSVSIRELQTIMGEAIKYEREVK